MQENDIISPGCSVQSKRDFEQISLPGGVLSLSYRFSILREEYVMLPHCKRRHNTVRVITKNDLKVYAHLFSSASCIASLYQDFCGNGPTFCPEQVLVGAVFVDD
jgi:hypothetical protein